MPEWNNSGDGFFSPADRVPWSGRRGGRRGGGRRGSSGDSGSSGGGNSVVLWAIGGTAVAVGALVAAVDFTIRMFG